MPRLEVHQLNKEDIYKDIVRINEAYRVDKQKETIKEGRVCLVRAEGRKCLAVLRGYQDSDEPQIRMDDYTRDKLSLQLNTSYEFELKPVGPFGQLRWAWDATEIGYQVSARLAVLGFVMGVLGLLLGTAGLVNWRWFCFLLRWL